MAEFIEQMSKGGELKDWTIALLAEGKKSSSEYVFSPSVSVDSFPSRGDKLHSGEVHRLGGGRNEGAAAV